MNGIKKILAGLINPQLKLHKNNQDETLSNNMNNNSHQINIGEKLAPAIHNNIESLNLNTNGANSTKNAQQPITKEDTTLLNTTKSPENPADRVLNSYDRLNILQDKTNAQKQIDSQNQKSVVLEKNNINAEQSTQPQNTPTSTASNKLNQILFGNEEPTVNTNQTKVQANNTVPQDGMNTATQTVINNEKASQAVSYQINNDVVKNTNKNNNDNISVKTDSVNKSENNTIQNTQQSVVKNDNPIINQEKTIINQPQAQNNQINNTQQTIYNEQYKEVFKEIDKNSAQQETVQKPVVNNNTQESLNITNQNAVNNEKASQAISYKVNNEAVNNNNDNNIRTAINNDKVNPVQQETKIEQPQQPVLKNETPISNQDKPIINQQQTQNNQVNNTAQTIYNEQYKEVFKEIDKNTSPQESFQTPVINNTQENAQKPIINNVQENLNIINQSSVNNEKASQAISYKVNNEAVNNNNDNNFRPVINNDKVNQVQQETKIEQPQQPVLKNEITVSNQDKPIINQPQVQNNQVNNTQQTIYNEQYKEVFKEIDKNSAQQETVQKPVVNNNTQESLNITNQNLVNNEKASQAISYKVNNEAINNNNDNNIRPVINNDKVNQVQQETKIEQPQQPILKNEPIVSNQDKPVINQPQTQNNQVNNTQQTIYNEQYKEVFKEIDKNSSPQEIAQKPAEALTTNINNDNKNIHNKPNIQPAEQIIRPDKISDSITRSALVKELLGLPKNLSEMLFLSQNTNSTINNNTLLLNNLNQNMLKNQPILSQIFDENSNVQPSINALQEIQNIQNTQITKDNNDAIALIFSGMVKMPEISALILKNSKHAVSQLVIAMASASQNEISEHLKETLSALNMCIALADSGTPAQTLKSLMLLYLPWLPLNEGIGFDLEVEPTPGENESNDSKLTVLIQTRNFNNVKGSFTLTTSNSVEAFIICSDDFPKATLQKKLKEECDAHSMNTKIDVEQVTPIRKEVNKNQEAKVNLSATNEMNPYLLLMAHSFIRNTIEIDSRAEYALAANEII